MRAFTFWVFIPCTIALLGFAFFDRLNGTRELWRAVCIGMLGGIVAAVAYDIFRLPFVFAREWELTSIVPPMNLFKVFPRFGAMILGETLEQTSYSLAAHVIGWIYHFSNGATFGVMYVALLNKPSIRSWGWGVLMAVGIEAAMLVTPYASYFSIPLTMTFIYVTLTAHTIFGAALGQFVRLAFRPKLTVAA